MSTGTLKQQRAVLNSCRNGGFFDDDDDSVYDYEPSDLTFGDDTSSYTTDSLDGSFKSRTRHAETFELAQFLATTGPEQYSKMSQKHSKQQYRRTSYLLNRLRKRPAVSIVQALSGNTNKMSSVKTPASQKKNTSIPGRQKPAHIPLPVYTSPSVSSQYSNGKQDSALCDSGICSEEPEKKVSNLSSSISQLKTARETHMPLSDSFHDLQFPMPPAVPAKSQTRSQPKRPAPLPADVASAAIAAATGKPLPGSRALSTCSSVSEESVLRSVPAAALRRRSGRTRQVPAQTSSPSLKTPAKHQVPTETQRACSHCRQRIPEQHETIGTRRLSCPPAMASGEVIKKEPAPQIVPSSQESKMLLAMIERLQAQLEEEQKSRRKLERAVSRQQQTAKKLEHVAQEKSRWEGDCLWLQDRIALLPE